MFQIDNATVATTQPPSTAPGLAGFFTDGNPATGEAATIVPAEWLNSLMLEVCNAITGMGQTLDKTKFNQLFTAIKGFAQNTGVTPSQFDSSTKTATTAFVQRALGNYQQYSTTNGALTLTAGNAGQLLACFGTGPYTVKLPAANAIPPGAALNFFATADGVTIATQGADVILPNNGASQPSILLKTGDTLTLVSNGSNSYVPSGGTASIPYSGIFKSGSGWARFPSGLILQWGSQNSIALTDGAVPTSLSINFPLAFPGGCFGVVGAFNTGANNAGSINTTLELVSNSQFMLRAWTKGYSITTGVNWHALGY